MTHRERFQFEKFCVEATDNQLLNIIEKEAEFVDTDPFRRERHRIARTIARLRGIGN